MKREITFGDKYGPAMAINDQPTATAYFNECVEHAMLWGHSREKAEAIERSNLGYWAGYHDDATRERVERLFNCSHPVFGGLKEKGSPTPAEAFQAGVDAAAGVKP